MRYSLVTLIALAAVLMLAACGGGGGNNNNNQPMVTVSPATANVQEGGTQQFTAVVVNSSNTAVSWQVNGMAGGNATVGTIDANGNYTAPDIVPNPSSITITAVLQANASVSGNGIVTITAVQFSNSSLKGNYIFSLSGIDVNGFTFYALGSITADGNGNITAGEEDLNDVSSGYFNTSGITGTYSVNSDGTGTLALNSPGIGSFGYAFAIRASGNASMNELDNNVINASGLLETQSATGLAAPSGSYAFGYSGLNLFGTVFSSIGLFNLQGGAIGGLQDTNFGSNQTGGSITTNQSLSGSYTSVDTFGRGTGLFPNANGTSGMVYYVVSGQRFRFLCPDVRTFFLGSADTQSLTTPFGGPYVLSTSANTQAGISYTLIQFNASNGNIASGFYDVNDTGTVGQSSLTGTYNLSSNGHMTGSFSVSGSTLPFTMYLVSATQAYYLDLRTNAVGSGNVFAQTLTATTNAAWVGSYALRQSGYFLPLSAVNSTTVNGQISADGNGTLSGTLTFNDPTNVFLAQVASGTYAVGTTAPGRTTVSITTPAEGTRTFIAYIVSDQRVQMIEVDNNLVSGGENVRQF